MPSLALFQPKVTTVDETVKAIREEEEKEEKEKVAAYVLLH